MQESLSESGHSLLETLVAMAILSFIIVFFTRAMINVSLMTDSRYRIIAVDLAQTAMEECLTSGAYFDDVEIVRIKNRHFRIEREVKEQADIYTISVKIYFDRKFDPVFSLVTRRIKE